MGPSISRAGAVAANACTDTGNRCWPQGWNRRRMAEFMPEGAKRQPVPVSTAASDTVMGWGSMWGR